MKYIKIESTKKFKTPGDEIKFLKNKIKEVEYLSKVTLRHSKRAESTAVKQALIKLEKNVVPIIKELEEFEDLNKKGKMTPQRVQMIFNVINKLKNGLRSSGVLL